MEQVFNSIKNYIQETIPENESVLCALSGGVDSTVMGVLLTRLLGADRVHCIFINHGLLRKNEYEEVLKIYKTLGLNVEGLNAEDIFLNRLQNISEPEEKRKIIGNTFIEVFEKNIPEGVQFLAQGTLCPDVLESVAVSEGKVPIKSHHNVGGLPEKMNLKLLEPFRELYKDDVRKLGEYLGVPEDVRERHPFPGPGLAVRIIGDVTPEKIEILKECDAIWIQELKKSRYYSQVWQAFCVLLPVFTVGMHGGSRTYERTLVLRAVTSQDGMEANWFHFSEDFLRTVSTRITSEVSKINRVVYDITSKPPGTIEWE